MRLNLTALPGFKADIAELPSRDLKVRALELLARIARGELKGKPLDARVATADLGDCRKIYFDLPTYGGKPRYRLVYRITPNEVSAVAVEAIAVGERARLDAYLRAARNLGRQ